MGGQTCALPISGNIDFRQSPTDEFDAAGGEGELHVHVANALQQGEVDRLLGVHVLVVVRDLHDVDDLDGQLAVVEAEELRARSEERRVVKASGSTCRSRWSPYP